MRTSLFQEVLSLQIQLFKEISKNDGKSFFTIPNVLILWKLNTFLEPLY